jgi:hypothetical protein
MALNQHEKYQAVAEIYEYYDPTPGEAARDDDSGRRAAFERAKKEVTGHLQARIDRIAQISADDFYTHE